MDLSEQNIASFVELGNVLNHCLTDGCDDEFNRIINDAKYHNVWFDEENVRRAFSEVVPILNYCSLSQWCDQVHDSAGGHTILSIDQGREPLECFPDMLCVLLSGNRWVCRLPENDSGLMPYVAGLLNGIDAELGSRITFTKSIVKSFDAVIIPRDCNETVRSYLEKHTHVKGADSRVVAALNGNETQTDLEQLADDVFDYFGLGCNSISKLYVLAGYDFSLLLNALSKRSSVLIDNSHYLNNYEYFKSVWMLNGDLLFDNGSMLLRQSEDFVSAPSFVNFEYYENPDDLSRILASQAESIRVVESAFLKDNSVPFGGARLGKLSDYYRSNGIVEMLNNL